MVVALTEHNLNEHDLASETDSDSDSIAPSSLFNEPEGYYKPEKPPTTAAHTLLDGRTVKLGLVGESPLWVSLYIQYTRLVLSHYLHSL